MHLWDDKSNTESTLEPFDVSTTEYFGKRFQYNEYLCNRLNLQLTWSSNQFLVWPHFALQIFRLPILLSKDQKSTKVESDAPLKCIPINPTMFLASFEYILGKTHSLEWQPILDFAIIN